MSYATKTTVSVDKTIGEIQSLLLRYGASGFLFGIEDSTAMLGFRIDTLMVRIQVPLPARDDPEFTHTPARKTKRTPQQIMAAWEQACRSRWRALALVIRAKLEAIEIGVSTIEEEFLAWTVLPDNRTVGQHVLSNVRKSIETGKVVKMLPGGFDS